MIKAPLYAIISLQDVNYPQFAGNIMTKDADILSKIPLENIVRKRLTGMRRNGVACID